MKVLLPYPGANGADRIGAGDRRWISAQKGVRIDGAREISGKFRVDDVPVPVHFMGGAPAVARGDGRCGVAGGFYGPLHADGHENVQCFRHEAEGMAGAVYRQLDDFKEDFVVGGLGHCK